MNRVKSYQATCSDDGVTRTLNFNHYHAEQCNGVIEPDGLNIEKAKGLIHKWNLEAQGLYTYSLCESIG